MKKLLSFLAAGAIALGLIGCSGDLHDTVDPSTIPLSIALQSAPRLSAGGVPGAMNNWDNTTKWTTSNDSTCTYVYEFKATAETMEWKAITTAGNWNSGAWGGGDNEALSVPLDTKTALVYDNATGGKKNCSTTGFKTGKMYSITLNYESGVYNATVTAIDKEAPVPFYLDGYFVSGGMNGFAASTDTLLSEVNRTVNTQTGYVTYTYDFAATATEHEFGIRNGTNNWKTKYTGATFAAGLSDFTKLTKNADANAKVTGLKAGASYKMTIQTVPDGTVSVKVTEVPVTIVWKIKFTNLPNAAKGKTAIVGGSWNWDAGWTSCWGGTKKVSDLANGVIDSTGAVTVTVPGTYKYDKNSTQTISFCGYYGTAANDDIATADGELKNSGENFSVTTTALTEDTTMLITVDWNSKEATVAACPPLATIEVTGLPSALNGQVLYLTGAYNSWTEPGKTGTTAVTVTDGKISVSDVDIKLSSSAATAFEGKFANTGWTKPEVCAGKTNNTEAANISVSFPVGKTKLVGTYVTTIGSASEPVYICTWEVQ